MQSSFLYFFDLWGSFTLKNPDDTHRIWLVYPYFTLIQFFLNLLLRLTINFYTFMIGYLKWEVTDLALNQVMIVTSSWVWYEVFINEITYWELLSREEVEMYIYHHITDNDQTLFGFVEKEEKQVFRELIKISGVGGKVALSLLSLRIWNLIQAVQTGDNKMIESVKWIWKKMAEKVILELKDKDFVKNYAGKTVTSSGVTIDGSLYENIKFTLTNMGYNPGQIDKVLQDLPSWMNSAETIIPYVIQNLK